MPKCWCIGLATLIVMVLALTIIVEYTDGGLFASWIVLTLYVITLFAISFLRFRQGKWKTIRVI
jgi:MATE family multidrug resistance protein